MKKVAIIGFGRFGKTLLRMFGNDFEVYIYNRKDRKYSTKDYGRHVHFTTDLHEIYTIETIFYCVPIPVFEKVIKEHKKYFSDANLLIDTLSVKEHPEIIFSKYLKGTKTEAILTHPMFGPDSSKNGFDGLPIVINKFKAKEKNYKFWKNYFKRKKLKVIEMSAKEHDKLAAKSQGVAHFIGRVLAEYGLEKTGIDTLGAKKLQEIMDQTCNDTWELFEGLQNYNPYTKDMRIRLGQAYDRIYEDLLPKKIDVNKTIYGIQGGIGSFNELAIKHYINKNSIDKNKTKIKYLFTSERVLNKLNRGDIDFGLFAIHNSIGGIVNESVRAMANYKFKIVEEFAIKIEHHLMKRKDVPMSDITQIMTHPQVFAQCKATLKQKYPQLKHAVGKGDLIDNAKAAEAVATTEIGRNTAYLGNKILSEIYNLEIVDQNLQDAKENFTSFLLVRRR